MFIFLLSGVAVVVWLWLRSRLSELDDRILAMERELSMMRPPAAEPVVEQPLWPVAAPEPPPAYEPEPVFTAPEFVAREPTDAPPAISWSDRIRAASTPEWESLVGGNVLNKLGALVLVIGIALFLGYSFRQLGPAGRALTAASVSLSLLGAGLVIERRANYRAFSIGLIGAGWAALYSTSYAIYALPAAKVIDSPIAGSLVMVMVAVGMIAHSLVYRSQAATATAYFAAFAALAVTPSTRFAVLSLIPLAASLLYLAQRFCWHRIAVFGLLATYGTCVARGSSEAPLAASQILFGAYWLIFELFDLLRVHRRLTHDGLVWISPLNAAGFLWLSYLAWSAHAAGDLWMMATLGAVLYLSSAVARGLLRPPAGFENGGYEPSLILSALLAGMAIVARVPGVWVSAALAVEAEVLYLAGVRLKLDFLRQFGARALVIPVIRLFVFEVPSAGETEVLGVAIHNWTPPAVLHATLFYLNRAIPPIRVWFGYAAAALIGFIVVTELPECFIGSVLIVMAAGLLEFGVRRRFADFRYQAYALAIASGAASVAAQLLAVPRHRWLGLAVSLVVVYAYSLRRIADGVLDDDERRLLRLALAAGTSGFAAALVYRTVPHDWLGLAWCALAVLLYELGARHLTAELLSFWPSVATLGAAGVAAYHLDGFHKFPEPAVWASYFGATAAAWYLTARVGTTMRPVLASTGAAFFLAALWLVLPDPLVTIAWTAAGIGWMGLGFRLHTESFRWLGNAVVASAGLRLLLIDVPIDDRYFHVTKRVLIATPVVASWYALARRFSTATFERIWNSIYLRAAAMSLAVVVYKEAAPYAHPAGWAALALALILAARRFDSVELRRQADCLAALTFVAAIVQLIVPPTLIGNAERWLIPAFVTAGFYAAQFLTRDRTFAAAFSILATILLTAILYRETSGRLLTVVWGVEGLALLGAGFLVRQRVLRLQGLTVLLTCISKLFLYDLRNLDTLYRILSFVALGVILLGVSWIYTRFQESLRRYL